MKHPDHSPSIGPPGTEGLVPIKKVQCLPELQLRKLFAPIVAQYVTTLSSAAEMPPITLARIKLAGGDALYLMDGFHRFEAARRLSMEAIKATIVDCADLMEAAWLAAKGNLGHGLRLRRAEVREAFRRYIRAGQHKEVPAYYKKASYQGKNVPAVFKSYRQMQADLGGVVNVKTIWRWLQEDFPLIAEAIGIQVQTSIRAVDENRKEDMHMKHLEALANEFAEGLKVLRAENAERLRLQMVKAMGFKIEDLVPENTDETLF